MRLCGERGKEKTHKLSIKRKVAFATHAPPLFSLCFSFLLSLSFLFFVYVSLFLSLLAMGTINNNGNNSKSSMLPPPSSLLKA
jgi:hypothetical protein